MEIFQLYKLLLLISVGQILLQQSESVSSSTTDYNLIPLKLYECENSGYADFNTTLRSIDDEGNYVLDMSVDLDERVNNDFTISLTVDQWKDDEWVKDFFFTEGNLCSTLNEYCPKVWENIKKEAKPEITEDCDVEPDLYILKSFTIKKEEVEVRLSVIGIFRMKVLMFNPNGDEVVCRMAEFEVETAAD